MTEQSALIVAGEVSGEEIALGFLPEILDKNPSLKFFGVGGESLSSLGVELIYHLKDFSSWGFSEVIGKIPFYIKALNKIEEECKLRNTKVAILVDFQTFNFKLAKKLHKRGIRVLYIVAPQAWAWKPWRAKQMAVWAHGLFCLIPFEVDWFKERGVKNVFHLSHPMYLKHKKNLELKKWKDSSEISKSCNILILPGSRKFEVKGLLPLFLEVLDSLKDTFHLNIGLLKSQSLDEGVYENVIKGSNLKMKEFTSTEEAFLFGDICLACSGTITLTCALYELPTIVCYKSSLLNQFIYETFVSYRGPISLGNIVGAGTVDEKTERVFPELIQDQVSFYNIHELLLNLLTGPGQYGKIRSKLKDFKNFLRSESYNVAEFFSKENGLK